MEIRYGDGAYALSLLVHRSRAQVREYINRFSHFSPPLNVRPGDLVMLDEALVICALHSAAFRFDDRYCESGPAASASLESVEVVVRDGSACVADGGGELARAVADL